MQREGAIKTIYDGLFSVAENISPLAIADILDPDQVAGAGLLYLGRMWALRGRWGGQTTGLVYDIDSWSEDKVWTGEMIDTDASIYRNFIRMKAYINGRMYSLITLQQAMLILLSGFDYTMTVDEGFMNFTINVTAKGNVLNILYNMAQYDKHFLGKPTGISYSFNFIPSDNTPVPGTNNGEQE